MSRGGRTNTDEAPERRCIATGESQPKEGLIRFVVGPDGSIVPDILARLPGRGIYVAADKAALTRAIEKRLFSKAARMQVTVPDDLFEMVDRILARRVIDLVALTRKAGDAVTGFEKVKDMLAHGRAKVLLQAVDGSERGKTKLWTPTGGRYFGCLTSEELGLAFGRQSVIHAALAAGGLTNKVVEDAARLRGVRGANGGDPAAGKDKTTT